jgi:hypothetical protein
MISGYTLGTMIRFLTLSLFSAVFWLGVVPMGSTPSGMHGAWRTGQALAADPTARNSRKLSRALSRLRSNPRYRGRILGTHIRRNNGGFVYEVRILRRDDRVILVYIDPQTGGVVGDSERQRVRKKPNTRNKGAIGNKRRSRKDQNIRRDRRNIRKNRNRNNRQKNRNRRF